MNKIISRLYNYILCVIPLLAFCPRLNRLDGGVNFGMFDYSGDLGPGELVMLICDEDYKPNSTDPLLCQDDFTWNASVPVCEQDIACKRFINVVGSKTCDIISVLNFL